MSWLTDVQNQNESFEKGLSQTPSIQNSNIDMEDPQKVLDIPETSTDTEEVPEAPKSWLTETGQQVSEELEKETGFQKGLRWLKEDSFNDSIDLLAGSHEAVTNLLWGALSFEASIAAGTIRMSYEKARNLVVSKNRERSPEEILEKVEDTQHWLPGLLPPPKTQIAKDVLEPVGDIFYWLFTGPRKIGKDMTEFYGPNAGWLSEQILTLGMCRFAHASGKELTGKIMEVTKNARGVKAKKVAAELDAILKEAQGSKIPSKYDTAFQKKVNEYEAVLQAEWELETARYEKGLKVDEFAPAKPGDAKSAKPIKLPKIPKERIIEFTEAAKEAPELSLAEKPKPIKMTLDTLNKAKKRRGEPVEESVKDTLPKETQAMLKRVPDLKTTGEAYKYAESATKEQMKDIELYREYSMKKANDLKTAGNLSDSFMEAQHSSLYREAIERYNNTGSAKRKVPEAPEIPIKPDVSKTSEIKLSKRAQVEHDVNLDTAKDMGIYENIKDMIGEKKSSRDILTQLAKGEYFKEDLKDFNLTRQDIVSAIQAVRIAEFKDPKAVKYLEASMKKESKKVAELEVVEKPAEGKRVDPETGRAPGMPTPERKVDLGTSEVLEAYKARQKPLTSAEGKIIKTKSIAEGEARAQGLMGELVKNSSGEGWIVKPIRGKKIKPSKSELQKLQKTWDSLLDKDIKESKGVDLSEKPFDATSWDGLLDLLKSERGAITIDPADFKKAADFLKSKGISTKNAIKLLKARGISDELIGAYYKKDGKSYIQNLNKESIESQWLKKGQDPKQLLKPRDLGKGRKAPAVSRGDAKIIENAPDIGRPLLGEKIRHLATSEGLMTSLGKPIRETFLRRAMKGEKQSSDIQKTLLEESQKLRKTLPFWSRDKSSKRIDNYAMSRQKGGAERLEAMEEKIVNDLSPAEMKIYDRMQEVYKDLYVKINKVRKASGQKEFPAVKNYSTWIHDLGKLNELEQMSMFEKLESIQKGLKKIQGLPSQLDKTGRVPSMKGHEKFRGGPDTPGYLKLDAFENFNQYAMMAGDVLGKTKHLSYLHELLQPKFELYKNASNTYNFLREWLDYQKGSTPEMFITNPKAKRWMAKLSGNVAVSFITFAPRSAMVQFSSLNNSIAEIGLPKMLQGVAKSINPAGIKRAARVSNALTVRTPEAIIMDSLIGTPTFPGKTGKQIHKVGKAAKKVGIIPLSLTDSMVAYSTWLGAEALGKTRFKKSAEYKKLSGKEAKKALDEYGINFADDVVIRAQGSAAKSARAPIQRTAEGKFITTLQTFTIANFDYLTRHVLGIKNPDITKPAQIAKTMQWVATSALISQGFESAGWRSPLPTSIKAYQESMEQTNDKVKAIKNAATEVLEFIPIYGGKYKFGSELFGAVIDQLVKLGKGDMTALPRLMGTPGFSTLLKGYRAANRGGTAADILMGRYIKKPKRSGSGGLSGF